MYDYPTGNHDFAHIYTKNKQNAMPICLAHRDDKPVNLQLTTFDVNDTFSVTDFSVIEKNDCFDSYEQLNYSNNCEHAATINEYHFCTATVREDGRLISSVKGELCSLKIIKF